MLDPTAKALKINLDKEKYGTLAEIGAGQEVARFFFRAGGASNTIAKTMSAYDMVFSDEIYGAELNGRYVCESRLNKMLDHEYQLLEQRLKNKRTIPTAFFVFADTVTTTSYKHRSFAHGWLGIRFQPQANVEPSQVVIHINMLDVEALDQQAAVGIVGVNLIYACMYEYRDRRKLIASLMDNLSAKQIEIDMIRFIGPEFHDCDNRLKNLCLLENNMTGAVMFDRNGQPLPSSELLYMKNILAFRGSFRPYTRLHQDMLSSALKQFQEEHHFNSTDVMPIIEMHHKELKTTAPNNSDQEFLARLECINAAGHPLLVSNYFEYYRLASYFNRHSKGVIGFVLGLRNLLDIFQEVHYEHLQGGILESFGVLFKRKAKFYIYPNLDQKTGEILNCTNPPIDPKSSFLYKYLYSNQHLIDIVEYKKELLNIYSSVLIKEIAEEKTGWEDKVPAAVAKVIKDKKLFKN